MKTLKQFVTAILILGVSMSCALTAAAAEADTIKAYTLPQEVLLQRVTASAQNGKINYISFYNIGRVSRRDLLGAVAAEMKSGGKVLINFDTLTGEVVTARITVDPLLVRDSEGSLSFIAETSEEATGDVKEKAEKNFGKPAAVIHCAQADSFDMPVVISAKLNVSALDRENLVAYSYNPDNDTFSEMKDSKCIADNNGFVYLQTQNGGYIVITER